MPDVPPLQEWDNLFKKAKKKGFDPREDQKKLFDCINSPGWY